MANSDKDIRIITNRNKSGLPNISFTGYNNDPIVLNVLDDNTISFEGSSGQLFSVSNAVTTGTIFSVNDISGIPSFRIDADGTVGIAEFSGNVGIGLQSPQSKLSVGGDINASIGYSYRINGTMVLNSSSLGTGVTLSSLTSVGTISSGTWQGSSIGVLYGGTGATNASDARSFLGAATAGTNSDLTRLLGVQHLYVTIPTAAAIGITVKGATSQSASMMEFVNSSNTLLAWITKDGTFAHGAYFTHNDGRIPGISVQRSNAAGIVARGFNSDAFPAIEVQNNPGGLSVGLYPSGLVYGGVLQAYSSTASTNTTTGALIVAGGAGIANTVNIGRDLRVFSSLASSSPFTGALVVSGGAGISNNLYVGGGVAFTASIASTSATTGTLVVTGGVGIGGSLFSSSSYANSISGVVLNNGSISLTGTYTQSNSSTTAFSVKDGSNTTAFNIDTIGDVISLPVAVASTSTGSGSLVVAGGVGIGGTLNARSVYVDNDLMHTPGVGNTFGLSFTSFTLPTGFTGSGLNVIYADNKFVATGGSVVAYSSDLINWTTSYIPWNTSVYNQSIAYGNGVYAVTSSTNSYLAYSRDLITWTLASLQYQNYTTIAYGNGRFVANAGSVVGISTNGVNWSSITPTGSTPNYQVLNFINGYFYSSGSRSIDGIYWEPLNISVSVGKISYGNGLYFGAQYNSSNYAYSYDGVNFIASTIENNVYVGSEYHNGVYYLRTQHNNAYLYYSTDGFNYQKLGFSGVGQFAMAFGKNKIVIFGRDGGSGVYGYYAEGTNGKIDLNPIREGNIDNTVIGRRVPKPANFTDISSTGYVNIVNTAGSASTISGALVVRGGVGIGGSLFVNSASSISNVILSAGVITGSLTGTATTATYAHQSGYGITAGIATTANYAYQSGYGITAGLATTATYSYQSGYGITAGLATTATYSYQSGYATTSGFATTATYSYQSGYATTSGFATSATSASIATTSYSVNVNSASSSSSHYIIFSPNATGSGVALSTESALVYNPSTDILSVSGLAVTSSLGSTSTSTGALTVSGGVGIGGTLNISGNATIGGTLNVSGSNSYFQNNLYVGNNTQGRLYFSQATLGSAGTTVIPTMAFIGATNSPITLSVLPDNSLSFDGSSGQLFSINNNLSTGWIFSINDISGLPIFRTNADLSVAMGEYGGNVGIGLSNAVFKLQVSGNAGISGTTLISNTTSSTNTTSGALVVSGGVGIGGSLNVNSASSISSVTFNSGVVTGNLTGTATTATYSNQSGYGITAGLATTSTYSHQSGYATTSGIATTATYAYQSGYAITSGSSSTATTATYSHQSGYGLTAGLATTATYANQAGYGITAGSANYWTTPRTLNLSGDLSGSVVWSGSGDTTITATIAANAVALGTDTTGQYASTLAISGSGITVTTANADDSTAYTIYSSATSNNTSSTIVLRDGSGNFSAGTITASLTGTATTATYANQAGYGITAGSSATATTATYAHQSGYAITSGSSSFATTASNININNATAASAHFLNFSPVATGSGVAVSSNTTLSYNPSTLIMSTPGLAVTSSTSSTSTTSGSLTAAGGFGLAGNAFIGGTVNITNTNAGSGVSSAALVVAGSLGVNGNVWFAQEPNSKLSVMQSSGDEGGEIFLNKPVTNTSITTGVTIDVFQNRLRFFEQGGSARGFYLDITTGGNGVGTNIMGGSSSGTVNSGTATYAAYYAATGTAVNENANLQFTGTGVSIGGNIASTSATSGSLKVFGGVGIGQTLFTSPSFASSVSGVILNNGAITNSGTITATGVMTLSNSSTTAFQVRDGSNNSTLTVDTIGDIVSLPVAVASTTTATGSLVVAGGVGIGGSASVGGRLQMFNGANYTAFVSSASGNTVYTLPATSPATGTSVLQSTPAGVMTWVPMTAGGGSGTVTTLTAGTGISFSTGSTITTTGTIRAKRPMSVSFCAGYTPAAAGADSVVIRLPDSPSDGVTSINYEPQEFHIRVETASATATTIQLEKYTGTGAFSGTAITSVSISGASTYEAQTSVFANAGIFLTSGDKLRINFTALSASHANFSVYLELEEV